MKRLPAAGIILSFFCVGIISISCNKANPPQQDFQIEPGFTLTLVAAEPLIKDPVDLEFNELGDALVLEMPGYSFEDKQSRIVVLKDKDGDGVYDDKILFIDNLQLATSFIPYKKGVLVAALPRLSNNLSRRLPVSDFLLFRLPIIKNTQIHFISLSERLSRK